MNLFLGNFDFEHHLGSEGPRVPPAQIRQLNDQMAYSLVPLAQPEDCIWTPEKPEATFADHLEKIGLPGMRFVSQAPEVPRNTEFVPWGWCTSVLSWAGERGWSCHPPNLAVVAEVNSREFSSALETELGVALPGVRAVRSLSDLELAISEGAKLLGGWVLKANFGMSARERIVVRQLPRESEIGWARRRLERGDSLFFEPWVEALAEYGCQFTVPLAGGPVLEGITGLLTDAQGTYRGSRLLPLDDAAACVPEHILHAVQRAAERIQRRGYFGPLGIDVMQYRTPEGQVGWRPLQDINARLTMGRVALGLRRLLAAHETADWLHIGRSGGTTQAGADWAHLSNSLPPGVRLLRLSPLEIGGRRASRGTALVIANNAETLNQCFKLVFPG
jgi:hypothetical protein